MIRVLPVLLLAFKIWMAIDAGRKRQPYYWFMIIFFVPFGDVVYFFVEKVGDFHWHKLAAWLRSPPTVDELQYRYRNTRSIDNRLALARGLAAAGRHVEAIVEFEGVCASHPDEPDALWGIGTSRAALRELAEASAALTRLVTVAPSYNDWQAWVLLAGVQRDRGLRAESIETLRTLVRKCTRADHQMVLAEALIGADRLAEAASLLDQLIEDHHHAPDHVRRRNRRVVAQARRLRADLERARKPAQP
jgi:hypothetical protein